MGNLSSSSSDHSGGGGGSQYSPIHRELGAILKARLLQYSFKASDNPHDY